MEQGSLRQRANRLLAIAVLLPIGQLMSPVAALSQTFSDVPPNYWAYTYIESLSASKITSGCGGGQYCPSGEVTRAQMAVFLERGMRGSSYMPPPATGTVFADVSAAAFAANFIEQLYADGITAGCGNGNYCPGAAVTRDQMAVFLLRAKYGATYRPPAPSGVFGDVPTSFWAAAWIERLAAEGITSGCGNGNYCPSTPVSRAQMAVFLVRAFNIPIRTPPLPLTWDAGNWDEAVWQ